MDEYISKQKVKDLMGCCLASTKAEYKAAKDEFTKARFGDYISAIQSMIDVVGSVEAVDVQPVTHWISVKDRLPEEQQCILAHEKDYGVMLGDYQGIKYSQPVWIVRKQGLIMRTTEVTHWMPLPEPPKDGDAE